MSWNTIILLDGIQFIEIVCPPAMTLALISEKW